VKIGLQIPRFRWPDGPEHTAATLREIARAADDAGFSSVWLMDHFFQIASIGKPEEPMLEAYTTLGFLAACTSRVQLGTLVTGVHYRHPGVLVKQVTTLDVLSGGRAWLGIGAGWYERESRGLGVPFPVVRDRFGRLEETLSIAHHMWRGDPQPFYGKHFQRPGVSVRNCRSRAGSAAGSKSPPPPREAVDPAVLEGSMRVPAAGSPGPFASAH
jgi:alkanesulfonate monooxygenase SsuD/methylene tetrahydromethanopterin reductase-like flavin-dependent oxidoreductase (luciferase family)